MVSMHINNQDRRGRIFNIIYEALWRDLQRESGVWQSYDEAQLFRACEPLMRKTKEIIVNET